MTSRCAGNSYLHVHIYRNVLKLHLFLYSLASCLHMHMYYNRGNLNSHYVRKLPAYICICITTAEIFKNILIIIHWHVSMYPMTRYNRYIFWYFFFECCDYTVKSANYIVLLMYAKCESSIKIMFAIVSHRLLSWNWRWCVYHLSHRFMNTIYSFIISLIFYI